MTRRCHYEFRWWYEYSGGKFTDWGAHHVDIALWAWGWTNRAQVPSRSTATDAKHPVPLKDGYPTVDDSYNTSHDFNVISKFADGLELHVTSRGDNGVLFEGEKGRIFVNRGRITGTPIEENWDDGKFGDEQLSALYRDKPFEGHKENFYPLHPRRRPTGIGCIFARADDERLPPLFDRRSAGSDDYVGPTERANHRRRAGCPDDGTHTKAWV